MLKPSFLSRAKKSALRGAMLLLLSACSGPALDSNPPVGFDLSGEWRLLADESEVAPLGAPYIDLRRGGSDELARGGLSTDYPVLSARFMRIEQDPHSMGIRYDRSQYRDISWGKRQLGMWTVDAGFSEGALFIYSEAHDSKATEVMQLSNDRNTLVVDIEVDAGEKFRLRRVFKRMGSAVQSQ